MILFITFCNNDKKKRIPSLEFSIYKIQTSQFRISPFNSDTHIHKKKERTARNTLLNTKRYTDPTSEKKGTKIRKQQQRYPLSGTVHSSDGLKFDYTLRTKKKLSVILLRKQFGPSPPTKHKGRAEKKG